jgi:hypothetical protein
MASTYSNIKIQLMATGENTTTWGDVTNVNLGTAIEEAIVGSADVAFSNDNVTLTLTDTNSTQAARNMRLNLTGTATTGYNLIVPAIEKPYIINNGTDGTITIKNSTGTGVAVPAGKTMWVYNNGTNVVDVVNHVTSLTTTGNAIINGSVGIGTSSPSAKLQVSGAVPDTPTTFNVNHGASGNDFDYASSTVSAVGGINGGFTAWGTGSARAGTLAVGTGSNHPMTFMTNDTEHMRIDTGGNWLVGTTTLGAVGTVNGVRARPDGRAIISSAADGVLEVGYNGANATGTVVSFYKGGALGGSITTDGSTTAYNTSSDYRLKDIEGPIANSGAYIDALNPVQGNWKADGSRFIGLLAHEVQEVSETPIATGEKDGEEMQAMDYSAPELITNLIAEIQSLRARVAQLEGN